MQSHLPQLTVDLQQQHMKRVRWWVLAFFLLSLLVWTDTLHIEMAANHFLTVHSTLEMGSIVVSFMVFGIAWHAGASERPGGIVLLGAVLMGTALIDFAHTLSYAGMPDVITPSSAQKSISFWIAARFLAALGFLLVAWRVWPPFNNPLARQATVAAVLLYVLLTMGLVLLRPDWVPTFFVPGTGLTDLKVNIEYLLIAMYGVAALLFYRLAGKTSRFNAADLFAAAAIAALSELFFSRYERVTDLVNLSGHVYKIASYWFIYRAVFADSVQLPFTALKLAMENEKKQAAEQHAFVHTLDMLEEVVLEIDPAGNIVSANNGWWQFVGMPAGSASSLLPHMHQEDREAFRHHLDELAQGDKVEFRGRFRFHVKTRPEQWMECRFLAQFNDDGQFTGTRGVMRDITKSYMQERHISYMALHDALTGLPNRVLLEDRIRQAIHQASRTGRHVAICFVDLDHFKNINDAYGHKSGDAYLLALSHLLKGCLREGDTLARWGGDEFVVLLPDLTASDAARQVAQKMVDSMRQTIELEEIAITATFSMGIAVYPDDDVAGNIDHLLAQADRAMFYAKAQGRNNFQMFSDMSSKGLGKKELYIQARLAQAVREERITVWFQPLVLAEPVAPGLRLRGIEALARWNDPELGPISPGSFIPMAENLGLISELGRLVRRTAFRHFKEWQQNLPHLTLSINISKRQLFASDFFSALMEDVEEFGLQPGMLVLEITESVALLDVDFAEERLHSLAQAGFTLAIDDFGTGYASLSQLHELPIKEIKIDISFIRRLHTPEGLRLVQGIVGLAQALRLRTVAEGVENEAAAKTLLDIGVDLLQGYHFGAPVSASEFLARHIVRV